MFIATLQSFKAPVVHFVLHERDRSRVGRRLNCYHPKNSYMFGMPYDRWTGQSQYENQEQKRTVSLLKMRKKVYTTYRTRNVHRSSFHENNEDVKKNKSLSKIQPLSIITHPFSMRICIPNLAAEYKIGGSF